MKNTAFNASRRAFLQRTSRLTLAGIAAPWALNFGAMAEASAADASGYKALVCVYLHGGNDYANMLPPYDSSNHALYQRFRPAFAFPREHLTPLRPEAAPRDSAGFPHEYALPPGLAPLASLFETGKLAVLLNVGTLVQPTSKKQYLSNAVSLPPKLFSHHDQSTMWQSASADSANSGWGGRMGDLLQASNGHASFTCVNLSGHAIYLCGKEAAQYRVTSRGSVPLTSMMSPLFGSDAASIALRALISEPRVHLLEDDYNRIARRSIEANEILTAALGAGPALTTPFPANNSLGDQLRMVARMMAAAPRLGARRQVFFVGLGGFDNHDNMASQHPLLMKSLGDALAAFYAATEELGIGGSVTTFTASEFGRSMVGNASGTEHGWGSTQFVLGGAVKGGRFYGSAPIVADDGPDDVGQGRLIPTTSVEQLAATMGGWMGVSDSALLSMLPSLSNFNAAERKLGFV